MFTSIFSREFKKVIKSPAFVLLFLLSFLMAFQDSANDVIGQTKFNAFGVAHHNSALFIAKDFALITFLTLLFNIILVARSVVKDIDARVHPFYFTSPFSKSSYILGRFFGGFTPLMIGYLGIGLGFFIGCNGLSDQLVGTHNLSVYLSGLIFFSLPIALFVGSIFFLLATLTRNMFLTYIAGVGSMLLFGVISGPIAQSDNLFLNTLFDPSGLLYLNYVSADWTVAEINANLIPLEPAFVLNRILLLVLSFGMLLTTVLKFKFIQEPEGKKTKKNQLQIQPTDPSEKITFISPKLFYTSKIRAIQLLRLIWVDAKKIIFHPAFLIITFLALEIMYGNFTDNVGPNGSNVYAITSWYLRFVDQGYGYILPITIFFGGMLVWKERDHKTDSFYNTLPVPSWMNYTSKLLVLFSVQTFYVITIFLAGVFTQIVIFKFTDIEPWLYFKRLVGIELLTYWHIAILVLFIQTLSSNKYLGFFLCALFYALDIFVFDVNDNGSELLRYGSLPDFIYSNLNGFGHYAQMLIAYRIYWFFPAIIVVILTSLLWDRGTETSFKSKLKSAKLALRPKTAFLLGGLILGTGLMGGYIYYNNEILNKSYSDEEIEAGRAYYEKTFKVGYEFLPKPSITDITLNVDLFPNKRNCLISGKYKLENKTNKPISKVLISLTDEYITHISNFELEGAKLTTVGERSWDRILTFIKPLQPNETTYLDLSYEIIIDGFSVESPKNAITANGSYIGSISGPSFFPTIGYDNLFELSNNQTRQEYDLPERKVAPSLNDKFYVNHSPSDIVNYSATVSTSSEQMVITNGQLQKEWEENGRRYFKYKTNQPINNAIAIISGKYEILESESDGINLRVYYDKKHYYNVNNMMKGMKVALDYCSKNFSEYPYNAARVVEVSNVSYPGQGTALSIPTLFAWQEYGGFISNLEDPNSMDVVFNTTTHEFAHQWWGHIVRPASVEGRGILSESMAQWVRLMCLEKEYGKEKVLEYLDDQSYLYFRWRKRDYHGEQPLFTANNQGYLLYNKGAIAMYALKEYMGEDSINHALERLVHQFGLKETGPFPSTKDLVSELRKVTPDTLQYLVTDLFERIILYNHKIEGAEAKQEGNAYLLDLKIESQKLEADSIGVETITDMNDYIPIRITDKDGQTLLDKKVRLKSGINSLEFYFDQRPAKVEVDPDQILIEREREDNSFSL